MTEKNEEVVEDKNISDQTDENLTEEIESEADDLQVEPDPQQVEIDKLTEQVNNLEEKLLRAQAEVQNIQQRNARELQNVRKYDGQKLASAVLPAVDNLERALQVEANDEVSKQIKTGVEMTLKTLNQALTDNGITSTGEIGESFDPTKHQAIQSVESDEVESDQIAQVLQKGYILQDRVIRPAMVAVAK